MIYMLDTNAASAALRAHPAIDAKLGALTAGQWCVSAVTCSELRYGVALRPDAARLHRLVDAFLEVAPVLAWDHMAATRHGMLRARLRRAGTPLGDFDEMIAGHALAVGAVLVTSDRAFARVPELEVEDWTAP